MTIIHRFSDLHELNNYISSSIHNDSMVQLHVNNIQEYAERFSLSPSLIHDIQNSSYDLITYHLYIGSKTSYRKNVHSNIPNVLYKKIYNCFKLNGYIREATPGFSSAKSPLDAFCITSNMFLRDSFNA